MGSSYGGFWYPRTVSLAFAVRGVYKYALPSSEGDLEAEGGPSDVGRRSERRMATAGWSSFVAGNIGCSAEAVGGLVETWLAEIAGGQ